MATIASADAKTRLSELLQRVANGERFTIVEAGVPVAELIPVGGPIDRERVRAAIAGLREFAKGQSLNGLSIREMREEGRR